MGIPINWDDVVQEQLIPEGRYPARIDKVEERVSESGNKYLNVEFTLTEEPYTGRKAWAVFVLDPRSLWKLRTLLTAMGFKCTGVAEFEPQDLVNQEVGIVITHEMYQEQPRNRVNSFFSLGG